MDPYNPLLGFVMLIILFTAFTAMTLFNVTQSLAMAVVACVFLAIQGNAAEEILRSGFAHFADIVVLFTAVAIPAHMIDRSGAFQWVQSTTGAGIGRLGFSLRSIAVVLMIIVLLAMTYTLAALMHNVTSILIMTSITIRLCEKFKVPSRHILCGMLVASNLGGFSTKWGDTPNIIESRIWVLTTGDFIKEVLPINLLILGFLCIIVVLLTHRRLIRNGGGLAKLTDHELARIIVDLRATARWQPLDRRLLTAGFFCLTLFMFLQGFFPELQIAIGAVTIVFSVGLDRPGHRLSSLKSLGFDTYIVFASIFVLAGCVEKSWIGQYLSGVVRDSGAALWTIVLTGYLGTTFTEAASWAVAASSAIHPLDSSHAAAWALGAGICAGSSSLVTAASAGIILSAESRRFKNEEHTITFRKYLPFGFLFSVFMLIIYITILTFWR